MFLVILLMGDLMNKYFKKFEETGRIEDYLAYARYKKNSVSQKESNNGINRRDSNKLK